MKAGAAKSERQRRGRQNASAPPLVKLLVVIRLSTKRRLLDLHEELDVALGFPDLVGEQFKALLGFESGEDAAQLPHDLDFFGREQVFFAAGAGCVDIHGREDALVCELAGQAEFHVAGALELFEDDLVHLGTGLDEGGGQDGERAAVFDVAGGTEEALGRVEGCGVDATGQDAAGGRCCQVVGAAQAGHGVQQDHHVHAHFHQALGAFDGEFGHGGVVVGGTVEGGGDDLTLDGALHVRDFFGPFVDQHHHEVDLRVVGGDGVGDGLQDERLAGLGRGDDQAALALSDRGHEVDDAGTDLLGVGLEAQALRRVERNQLGELDAVLEFFGRLAVDGRDAHQGVELLAAGLLAAVLAFAGCTDGTHHGVALAQVVLLDLGQGDVDVVGAGQVAGGADERVVLENVEDAGNRQQDVVVGNLNVVHVRSLVAAAAAVVAVAEAVVAGVVPVLAAGAVVAVIPVAAVAAVAAASAVGVVVVPVVPAAVALAGVAAAAVVAAAVGIAGVVAAACPAAIAAFGALPGVPCFCGGFGALFTCTLLACTLFRCRLFCRGFHRRFLDGGGSSFAAAAVAGAGLAALGGAFGCLGAFRGGGRRRLNGCGGRRRSGFHGGSFGCRGYHAVADGAAAAAASAGTGAFSGRSFCGGCFRSHGAFRSLVRCLGRGLDGQVACAVGGDGRDQVPLAHAGAAGDTELAGEGLQLGELKAGKAAALGGCCR